MELLLASILFLIGLGLIVKGGDLFVDAAVWMARASGMPQFLIGATIVSHAREGALADVVEHLEKKYR